MQAYKPGSVTPSHKLHVGGLIIYLAPTSLSGSIGLPFPLYRKTVLE